MALQDDPYDDPNIDRLTQRNDNNLWLPLLGIFMVLLFAWGIYSSGAIRPTDSTTAPDETGQIGVGGAPETASPTPTIEPTTTPEPTETEEISPTEDPEVELDINTDNE